MPTLIHKFLSKPEIFWKPEGFLYKAFRFRPVRQKTVRQNRDAPSSYARNFSIKELFWNTKVFCNEKFRYSATKTFRRKIVIRFPPLPLLSIKTSSLQKFFKTQNGSLAQFSRFREIKKTFEKTVKLLLLCWKFFNTRILSKRRSVHLRTLLALSDTEFSTEFSDIPFLCIKFCDTRNFLKHQIVPQQNFLVLCDKNFRRRNAIPPIMHKTFRYPKISETMKWCPRIFSALWDQNFSTEKRDFTLIIHTTVRNQKFSQKQ